ncbi:MAG: DUF6268 family outer membrane beta-barrel protein [Candidatus Omnitrophota bacterium]
MNKFEKRWFITTLFILAILFDVRSSFAFVNFFDVKSSDPWEATLKTEYTFETGVDSQDGDFSVGHSELGLKKEFKLENGLPVDFGIAMDHYTIHDDTPVDLPASLQSKGIILGAKMPMPFTTSDYLFMGVSMGAYLQSAGDHAFHSSAFRFKNRLYGIYKKDERFIFVMGVMANPDYEERAVRPFAGMQYLINDRWSIHFLSDDPFVAYRLSDRTTLKCQLSIINDEFEVVSGSRRGEIVNINEYHIGLGVEHEIKKDMNVQGTVGWATGRKYEYLKDGGKVVPEDGIFLGLSLNLGF